MISRIAAKADLIYKYLNLSINIARLYSTYITEKDIVAGA